MTMMNFAWPLAEFGVDNVIQGETDGSTSRHYSQRYTISHFLEVKQGCWLVDCEHHGKLCNYCTFFLYCCGSKNICDDRWVQICYVWVSHRPVTIIIWSLKEQNCIIVKCELYVLITLNKKDVPRNYCSCPLKKLFCQFEETHFDCLYPWSNSLSHCESARPSVRFGT